MQTKYTQVLMKKYSFFLLFLLINAAFADDGGRLWLRYDLLKDTKQRESYAQLIQFVAS
ncbi:MAG: hypothetical protein R2822_07265 [Spirosomataceae bacterium]